MAQPYALPAPPRRRPKRWPWVVLAIIVVLVGLFVAADRVALAIAEDKAGSTLQTSQHLNQKPDVTVDGFPFLTQLAAGEFDDVSISAKGIDVGTSDRTLRIASVTVHLHDVTIPRDVSVVRAKTAQADGRITYADLSKTLGVAVRNGGNGRLVANPTVTVAGQTFHGQVSAVLHATSDNGITFGDPKVSAGSVSLPDPVTTALAAVFSKTISLAGLPFNIKVTGADVTTTGLVLHLSGSNLIYRRS
jgi:LmeA-like phospholipid-binding